MKETAPEFYRAADSACCMGCVANHRNVIFSLLLWVMASYIP